jgi:hypothetical protein
VDPSFFFVGPLEIVVFRREIRDWDGVEAFAKIK